MANKTKTMSQSLSDFADRNKKIFQDMRNYGAIAFAAISAGIYTTTINAFAEAEAQMAKVDAVLKTLSESTLKKAGMNMD
jgi:hypothetical protein